MLLGVMREYDKGTRRDRKLSLSGYRAEDFMNVVMNLKIREYKKATSKRAIVASL